MSDNQPAKQLGPPPVDPMTPAAWQRVERGLWAKLDAHPHARARTTTQSPRWRWLAIPLAAAAMLVVVLTFRDRRVSSSGEPSRVVAGDTASTVSYGDAHLTLSPHAAIVMRDERGAATVTVDRGETAFVVAPRNDRPPFVVRAGDVIVRVVGTEFRVARSDERITVAVERGIVDVQYRAQLHRLTAGQRWSSDAPDAVIATVLPSPLPTSPTVITTTADTPPPVPAPPVPAPPVPVAPTRSPAETPVKATENEREKFERLSALEARDPVRALAGYLDLSRGTSAWSAVSLYAAGRLAAERHDKRARSFLELYLRRFPTGANAGDARDVLNRLPGAP